MKILVGADGSKAAFHAVRYAAGLLQQLGSELNSVTLVTVHDQTRLRAALALVGRDHLDKHLHQEAELDLKAAQGLLDAQGIRHDADFREGDVAEQIVECARGCTDAGLAREMNASPVAAGHGREAAHVGWVKNVHLACGADALR